MKKCLMKVLEWLLPANIWPSFESPFQSLTPTEDAEDIRTYSEAMDFALSSENKAIKNIAVTGLYGAGKSSFLRTYFNSKGNVFRRKKKVLWVSLALFLEQNTIGNSESDKTEFGHKLELSILQQIIQMHKDAAWWSWKIVIVALFVGGGVVGIMQPNVFVKYVTPSIHNWVANHACIIFWLSLIEVVIVSIMAMRKVIYWFKNIGIKRVDVSGAGIAGLGIEMPDIPSCSILNRNIRTIINFFSGSKYSTVVFEDIDRFNDLRIFTKLRELNLLLNNSHQISDRRKPIKFIYALREELFEDEKSKVKFFDFVIPIIPRINASNSRTELLEVLGKLDNDDLGGVKLDEALVRFVKEVSPYISDMRLLKNICNDISIP